MQGCVQYAFDPRVFDMVEQDAAVALFESLRVAFEDVEDFLDEGRLLDDVVVPDDYVMTHDVTANDDLFVTGFVMRF
jgi:hypothetical protein